MTNEMPGIDLSGINAAFVDGLVGGVRDLADDVDMLLPFLDGSARQREAFRLGRLRELLAEVDAVEQDR